MKKIAYEDQFPYNVDLRARPQGSKKNGLNKDKIKMGNTNPGNDRQRFGSNPPPWHTPNTTSRQSHAPKNTKLDGSPNSNEPRIRA